MRNGSRRYRASMLRRSARAGGCISLAATAQRSSSSGLTSWKCWRPIGSRKNSMSRPRSSATNCSCAAANIFIVSRRNNRPARSGTRWAASIGHRRKSKQSRFMASREMRSSGSMNKNYTTVAWKPRRGLRLAAPLRSVARQRCILPGIIILASFLTLAAAPKKEPVPRTPGELFTITNVWTVHLKFTPEQWQAMEPENSGPAPFGGPGGPRSPGGFGPALFIAPSFLSQGDQNHDGKLSKDEFRALAEKWFGEWDKEKRGKLDGDQLRAGLSSTLAPPNFGPPGAGGPGGRGPGMNLQGPEGKRNGLSSAAGIEFKYVHADLEFEGQLLKDVAVRYKGNGTWMQSQGSLKRSLKVDFNHFAKGQQLAGVSKLNFHNNVTDASWMNEVLAHRLFRDAGVPAPRTAYARVFLTVQGKYDKEYVGLYSVVEDVDKHFAEESFGATKGAIFKPVTPNLFADLGGDWAKYKQTYDPKIKLSNQDIQRVIAFCRLVTQAGDAEFAARLGDYVDLGELARFMAVTVWLSDLDGILGPGQNLYLYLLPKTHQFQFIPWDLDHSFGQFGMRGTQEQRENLSIKQPWQGENRFLERVFKVAAFKQLYLARLAEFNGTIFQPE